MTQHSCHVLCLVGLQNIISAEPLRRPSGCESELEETLVDLPGLLLFSLLSLAFLLHHSICLTAHCFLIVWCKSAVCVWNENKTQADQQSPSVVPCLLCYALAIVSTRRWDLEALLRGSSGTEAHYIHG